MRKFLIKSGLFIAIVFAIIGIAIFVTVKYIPVNTDHYNYTHNIKMERLDTLASPRLIFVGGSNVAFGLNSERISDSLGINVQNTAVHAGIGLRYMLSEVGARVRKGDIVVIMPEYTQFDWQYNGDDIGTLTDAFVYSGGSGWDRLDFEQRLNVLCGFNEHIKGRRFNLAKASANKEAYPYTSRNFNEYGDESEHRSRMPRKLGLIHYTQKGIKQQNFPDISEKVRGMERQGARVIFIWPTTIRSNYEANREVIQKIEETLEKYGIKFVTTPDYLVEPDSLAFDTPFHMSGPAVEDVTDKIIKCLKVLQLQSCEKRTTGAVAL